MRIPTMAAMALLSAGITASAAHAQTCGGQWLPGYGIPGVNGTVDCMTVWDPDGPGPLPQSLVIGGAFSIVHTTPAKNLAMWDGNQWTEIGGGTAGAVQQLCVYDGKLYVGGTFSVAGGVATGPLASWNGSAWNGVDGAATSISALQVYNGELVAAGSLRISGSGASIAKWNGTAWSFLGPASTVSGGSIRAMTVHRGKLIAAGTFTSVGGKTAGGIAAWDGAWTPLGTGAAAPSEIRALRVYNEELYAGGTFTTIGGVSAKALARWTGTTWEAVGLPLPPGISLSAVDALTVFEGKLVISGSGVTGGCVAWDGNAWSSVGQGGVQARCLQPFGTSLFAGRANSSSTVGRGLTELHNGRWKPIGIGFDGGLSSLDVYQDQLVLGGSFRQVAGADIATIARWNGAAWSRIGTPNFTSVSDILAIGSRIYGWSGSTTIVSWDGATWTTIPGLHFFSRFNTLSKYGSELVVAGEVFFPPSPFVRRAVATWDGTAWRTLGTDLIGAAGSAVEHEGELIVAGTPGILSLTSDPSARPPFRFDGTTWRGWPVGIDRAGWLLSHNGTLFMASNGVGILDADGRSYGSFARWDNNQWKSMDQGPLSGLARIIAWTSYKGDLIAAGNFRWIDGVAVNNIARWNGTQWKAMGSGLEGDYVYDVQQFGDELIAIGGFTTAGGSLSANFARWTDDPKPWLAVQPQTKPVNQGLALSLQAAAASGYVNVTYQWKRNGEAVQDGPSGASVGGGSVSGAAGALASPSDGSDVVLRIEGVQASDAGEYTVEFSNACNTTSSWAAAVAVNTCPGDLNADGLVNDTDFAAFAAAYDTMLCDDSAMPVGCLSDWNGDSVVDDRDFQIFVVSYGGMVCE
jgi:hypothetical protein